jgi:NarL family two-component system response regulator LiaR
MLIRVLLIDDHEMVRMGLSAYLATQSDIEIVGEASDGRTGVQLAVAIKPDVILMDLLMEGMDGISATREICELLEDPKIIVLTSFMDDNKLYPALEAGALSYLLKTSRAGEIVTAIRSAAKGESVLEAKVTSKVISKMRHLDDEKPHETLTSREMQVLQLIADGHTNQEIADKLFITVKTVKTHITNLLSKLGLDDRTQAAIYAHRNKLVE